MRASDCWNGSDGDADASPATIAMARSPSAVVQPSGSLRSNSSISAGGQVCSVPATVDAFLRKSEGPRLSPRNRRTSPVEAPSS